MQKWARGIIEFEPKKETGSRYTEPLELFLEKYIDPKTQEASLRVIHRRRGFRITYGALTNLPIKREQIVYLKYKNSGASYALENTAQSFQDLFDGKPGDLNKLEFGEFGDCRLWSVASKTGFASAEFLGGIKCSATNRKGTTFQCSFRRSLPVFWFFLN